MFGRPPHDLLAMWRQNRLPLDPRILPESVGPFDFGPTAECLRHTSFALLGEPLDHLHQTQIEPHIPQIQLTQLLAHPAHSKPSIAKIAPAIML